MIVEFNSVPGEGLVKLLSFVHSHANAPDNLNRFILVKSVEPFEQEREEGTRYGVTINIREWEGASDILLKVYMIIDESRKKGAAFP